MRDGASLTLSPRPWRRSMTSRPSKLAGSLQSSMRTGMTFFPLLPRELHLAIDPVRLHRSMRQDDDEGIAFADARLDPVPKKLIRRDGVAVIENLVVAKRVEILHHLLHVAVVRAAVADERVGHGVYMAGTEGPRASHAFASDLSVPRGRNR